MEVGGDGATDEHKRARFHRNNCPVKSSTAARLERTPETLFPRSTKASISLIEYAVSIGRSFWDVPWVKHWRESPKRVQRLPCFRRERGFHRPGR